ncbi:RNA polymerase sigma factor [Patescibacteria group bacterium]|nr:RNA polymerase sigma factor [Patescibacteria group bacterium]
MNSPSTYTDEQLAKLVQEGDGEQFGTLMERYQQKLFRYGRKFLASEDNIEDVVQDVFIKTYQNIQSFDVSQRFSPWIYRIAHNTYVNALKKSSNGPLYIFDFDTLISHTVVEDPIEKEREQKEIKEIVDKGLGEIEPKYREMLVLYYIEDLSYKEISDILRVPIGTVGVRIMRAKEILKETYKKMGIEIK